MRPHVPPRIGYGAWVSDLHPAARERTAKQPFYRPGPAGRALAQAPPISARIRHDRGSGALKTGFAFDEESYAQGRSGISRSRTASAARRGHLASGEACMVTRAIAGWL
jgi:hypothetical protein